MIEVVLNAFGNILQIMIELWIKTWIIQYSKCTFDTFGKPHNSNGTSFIKQKYLTEIMGALINLKIKIPSQTKIMS